MFKKALAIISLISVFVLSALAGGYFTLTWIISSEDTVIIPDLYGKDVVYALELLTDLGLNIRVKGSEYNSSVPKNTVLHQSPEAGAEIKKGRDIRLILSKGPQTLRVPNLNGLDISQADIILDENELCMGEPVFTYNPDVDKNRVMSQYPRPGGLINRGSCINILASLGARPKAYLVPDFNGTLLEDAIRQLEHSRVAIGTIRAKYDSKYPENMVLSQNPSPGSRVETDAIINITINKKSGSIDSEYATGLQLLRYRSEEGFLKQHIRINWSMIGLPMVMYDELIPPDRELWFLVPSESQATIRLYVDDELISLDSMENYKEN